MCVLWKDDSYNENIFFIEKCLMHVYDNPNTSDLFAM